MRGGDMPNPTKVQQLRRSLTVDDHSYFVDYFTGHFVDYFVDWFRAGSTCDRCFLHLYAAPA